MPELRVAALAYLAMAKPKVPGLRGGGQGGTGHHSDPNGKTKHHLSFHKYVALISSLVSSIQTKRCFLGFDLEVPYLRMLLTRSSIAVL